MSIHYGSTEIPLSPGDKSWVDRLITAGLNNQELWKIADMREYIYKVSRLAFRSNTNTNTNESNGSGLQHLDILPRNVFFDTRVETEFLRNPIDEPIESIDDRLGPSLPQQHRLDNTLGEPEEQGTRAIPSLTDDFAQSLIIGKSKAAPSVVTHEENAYGELESSFQSRGRLSFQAKKVHSNILSSIVTNSYTGKDPFIVSFLKSVKFEPSLEEFEEFSENVDISGAHISKSWNPTGDLVSHLKEHAASITALDISPDHSFLSLVTIQAA